VQVKRHGDGDHADVASSLDQVGESLAQLGSFRDALSHHEQAVAMRGRLVAGQDDIDLAAMQDHLGHCLLALGRFDTALTQFELSLAAVRSLHRDQDDPVVAVALSSRATCLQQMGRLHEARAAFAASVDMLQRCNADADHPDLLAARNNLALCLDLLGQSNEALPLHEATLATWYRIHPDGSHPVIAIGENNIGVSLRNLGRAAEALTHFEASLAILRSLLGEIDHPHIAGGLNNRALCHLSLGRVDEALQGFSAVLAMNRRLFPGAAHPDIAAALASVAHCHALLHEPEQTLQQAQAALAMCKQLLGKRDHPLLAGSTNNVALCLGSLGRTEEALAQGELALDMCRRLYGDIDHPDLVVSLNSVAAEYAVTGSLREARARSEEAVDMIERLRATRRTSVGVQQAFFDDLKRGAAFERLQALCLQAGDVDESVRAAERGRARNLLDALEQRVDPLDDALFEATRRGDAAGLDKLQELRSALPRAQAEADDLLQQLLMVDPASAGDLRARGAATAARLRRLLDERMRLLGDVLPVGQVRTCAEIQAVLEPGELLLEFTVAAEASVLYVLAHDAEPTAVPLPKAVAATARCVPIVLASASHRAGTSRRGRDPDAGPAAGDTIARSHELFTSLVPAELWPRIRAAKRVFLAAHRALHRLPFELLVVDEGRGAPRYWLDDGPPIAYVPSGSALHWLRSRADPGGAKPGPQALLAIGDPSLAGADEQLHLQPLQGARAEAESIRKAFLRQDRPAVLLLGAAADEAAVYEAAPAAAYLHFACHGVADTAAGGVGMLVLAQARAHESGNDGLLQLDDLLGAWRGRLAACRLVVLSACQTNVGPTLRDEAPQALPTGFLIAGARAVVSSLWAVDDESTCALMTDFYRRLLTDGGGELAAFTAAKQALRAKHPDPFHWAPFLYLGRPQ
jgi:tetratricopeptide (TPR) repeat protein